MPQLHSPHCNSIKCTRQLGYRVSLSKAQIASTTVSYIGLLHTPTSKIIPAQRLRALAQTPRPQTKRDLLSLLGLLNFFRIWVPNFALHANSLYQATQRNLHDPLLAPTSLHTPIQTLIKHLLQAPSLYLPDYTKPFFLFVHSRQGHALGILCQKRGDIWGPLAYLSKQLDLVILGWPPCLQALAATTLLIPEAQKLTQNAPLNVCSPHSFKDLLSHRAFLSLPPARLQILHTHLLDPSLSFMPCKPLNPASLLPTPDPEAEHLSHDCVQTLDMTLNPFEHITDQPLTDPKVLTCSQMAVPRNKPHLGLDML